MLILGIDPGVAHIGYGILKVDNAENIQLLGSGVITTSPHDDYGFRLERIYEKINQVFVHFTPDVAAIESIFYSRNLKSLVEVSEAIGVITLAAHHFGLDLKKFTPLEVKSAVTGFGKATKGQIQEMIKQILNIDEIPKSSHIADAIAVAICYRNMYCH